MGNFIVKIRNKLAKAALAIEQFYLAKTKILNGKDLSKFIIEEGKFAEDSSSKSSRNILEDFRLGKSNKLAFIEEFWKIFSRWDMGEAIIKSRLVFISCSFVVCFIILSYRLILIASHGYDQDAKSNSRVSIFRKEIVDRNGTLLAVNLPSASLFVNPTKAINPQESIEKLASIIKIDKKKLAEDLKSDKNFIWIKRDLSPREQTEIFNLGLPGFDFEREHKRVYTFGNLLSHVLGYVGRDFVGLAGLEKSYDGYLTNKDITLTKEDYYKPLELSIDIRLQNILDEEINRVIKEFRAAGAVGIIADPNNGEILAMVSKPDFDPHRPQEAKPQQLFNNATLAAQEFGSVFKSATLAIAIDTGAITLNDAYDISGMKVGKFQVKDYHPMKGWHSVPEIFLHSSNIGVGQIMLEIGSANLKKYLKNLGLLDQLKIELPERATPLFPKSNKWDDLSLVTMSYGYALSISAAHFVQAMIPVVNGGSLYPITLIKRNGKIPEPVRVFKENTSKEMLKLFRLVVKEGTGKKAEVKGYHVGGKTGTAHKLANGKYVKNARISSFFGVFPASKPRYIIYIMFDNPQGNKETFGFATAGWTAAPAVGRVLERMIPVMGIEPIDVSDEESQEILDIQFRIDEEV